METGGSAGEEEVCHHDGAVDLEEVELCGWSESGEDRSGDGEGDNFDDDIYLSYNLKDLKLGSLAVAVQEKEGKGKKKKKGFNAVCLDG